MWETSKSDESNIEIQVPSNLIGRKRSHQYYHLAPKPIKYNRYSLYNQIQRPEQQKRMFLSVNQTQKKRAEQQKVISSSINQNIPISLQQKMTSLSMHQTKRKRRRACGNCPECLRFDCGECLFCKDKPKFGGLGTRKQRCKQRICSNLQKDKVHLHTTGRHNRCSLEYNDMPIGNGVTKCGPAHFPT